MVNIKSELMQGLHKATLQYGDGCEQEILFITSAIVMKSPIWTAYSQLNQLRW